METAFPKPLSLDLKGTLVTAVFNMLIFLVLAAFAAAAAGDEACLKCHDGPEVHLGFQHSTGDVSCTSCHGPSLAHLEARRNPPDISFSIDSDETGNSSCLACHGSGSRIHWETAAHGAADLSCTGCHDIHTRQDPALVRAEQNARCATCHQDVMARFRLPSTHAIGTDGMQCVGCHEPHGSSTDFMLTGATPVETCAECHNDKRGPLLFEHEPVTEDCGLCHEPHGSIHDGLLSSRPTFLCQQCHQAANHPSRLADGSSIALRDPNLLIRGCVNCHSQVHGSNHPSGSKLTR